MLRQRWRLWWSNASVRKDDCQSRSVEMMVDVFLVTCFGEGAFFDSVGGLGQRLGALASLVRDVGGDVTDGVLVVVGSVAEQRFGQVIDEERSVAHCVCTEILLFWCLRWLLQHSEEEFPRILIH